MPEIFAGEQNVFDVLQTIRFQVHLAAVQQGSECTSTSGLECPIVVGAHREEESLPVISLRLGETPVLNALKKTSAAAKWQCVVDDAFVLLAPRVLSEAVRTADDAVDIVSVLQTVSVPQIDWRAASIADVARFLSDPLNVMLPDGNTPTEPVIIVDASAFEPNMVRISMDAQCLTLWDTLRIITRLVPVECLVEGRRVRLVPLPLSSAETPGPLRRR
jgi:hypothetical protein